ncbi:MAG TPA: response regulator [Bryobacteraceae bacterium]|nr:response regulator [Bryobacteraceae bacterium]
MIPIASPRLVLIEDNPADVLLIREAIRNRGLSIDLVSYSDVPDAIAALFDSATPVPDAILLDLNLPKGDGISVIETVRGSIRLQAVPMGILTSSESPRDLDRARQLNVACYINKPSTLDEFLSKVGDAVSDLLARRRQAEASS